jgi:hypothetical protein
MGKKRGRRLSHACSYSALLACGEWTSGTFFVCASLPRGAPLGEGPGHFSWLDGPTHGWGSDLVWLRLIVRLGGSGRAGGNWMKDGRKRFELCEAGVERDFTYKKSRWIGEPLSFWLELSSTPRRVDKRKRSRVWRVSRLTRVLNCDLWTQRHRDWPRYLLEERWVRILK